MDNKKFIKKYLVKIGFFDLPLYVFDASWSLSPDSFEHTLHFIAPKLSYGICKGYSFELSTMFSVCIRIRIYESHTKIKDIFNVEKCLKDWCCQYIQVCLEDINEIA